MGAQVSRAYFGGDSTEAYTNTSSSFRGQCECILNYEIVVHFISPLNHLDCKKII